MIKDSHGDVIGIVSKLYKLCVRDKNFSLGFRETCAA